MPTILHLDPNHSEHPDVGAMIKLGPDAAALLGQATDDLGIPGGPVIAVIGEVATTAVRLLDTEDAIKHGDILLKDVNIAGAGAAGAAALLSTFAKVSGSVTLHSLGLISNLLSMGLGLWIQALEGSADRRKKLP